MLGLESEILVETRDTDVIGRGLTGMSSEETAATGDVMVEVGGVEPDKTGVVEATGTSHTGVSVGIDGA